MTDHQETTPSNEQTTGQALAAVAAVAVALAQMQTRQMAAVAAVSTALLLQAETPTVQPWQAGTPLSPWQLIMRANQLAKKSRGSLR